MKKTIAGVAFLILLTGCTNQNQTANQTSLQQSIEQAGTISENTLTTEEILTSNIEETVTVEKMKDSLKKDLSQGWKKAEKTVYTTQMISLYEKPSLKSSVCSVIGPGDALKQTAVQKGWVEVAFNGKKYYAQSQYITEQKPKNAWAVSHAESIQPLDEKQIQEISSIDATVKGYGSGKNRDENNRPFMPVSLQEYYRSKGYNVTFIGDNTKYVFLTFDMGWEYSNDGVRNTEKLLDLLKEKNVKAAFFVTYEYVNQHSKDLVQRMIEEGHVVGSHGYDHPYNGIPSLPLQEQIQDTLNMQKYIKDMFNYDMYMYRFSSSYYSDRSIAMVNKIGYHTSFWSVESVDWEVDNQPDPAALMQEYMTELHPGAIYMMHAVSNSNMQIMSDFIDKVRENGYEFGYYCR
ncbi:MAG: polysaccharide deacetylase family protein [Clostridiales bacterium]|nr:polysaccharide deacetylase family protein [Clostridiales bacterium]